MPDLIHEHVDRRRPVGDKLLVRVAHAASSLRDLLGVWVHDAAAQALPTRRWAPARRRSSWGGSAVVFVETTLYMTDTVGRDEDSANKGRCFAASTTDRT